MRKITSLFVLIAFIFSCIIPPQGFAQSLTAMGLMSAPGVSVPLSPVFMPAHLKGMAIDIKDPFKFDFLIHRGDEALPADQKQAEYSKLIKYFLAALAVPDTDQWVNLSPYENNRIIADNFGKTEMGRDLLAQDYLLKQISSSLTNPDSDLGKKFWDGVYAEAQQKFGTTDIPTDTFNKVWILPDRAEIYEKGNVVYVLSSHLKVMMEKDYVATRAQENQNTGAQNNGALVDLCAGAQGCTSEELTNKVMRQVIIPAIEKEVNEGKNFAPLRQVYSGMLLATWYKRALKESILTKVYANQGKVKGVDQDPKTNQEIYTQYVAAFKKGVFNMIKEDVNKYTQEIIPRKYFSGGAWGTGKTKYERVTESRGRNDFAENSSKIDSAQTKFSDPEINVAEAVSIFEAELERQKEDNPDAAMTKEDPVLYQQAEEMRLKRLSGDRMEKGFWNNNDMVIHSIWVTLDAIPGFKEARQNKDIGSMTTLFRAHVFNFVSQSGTKRGPLGFFEEVGGLRGLMASQEAYLSRLSGPAELMRVAFSNIPEFLEAINLPDAAMKGVNEDIELGNVTEQADGTIEKIGSGSYQANLSSGKVPFNVNKKTATFQLKEGAILRGLFLPKGITSDPDANSLTVENVNAIFSSSEGRNKNKWLFVQTENGRILMLSVTEFKEITVSNILKILRVLVYKKAKLEKSTEISNAEIAVASNIMEMEEILNLLSRRAGTFPEEIIKANVKLIRDAYRRETNAEYLRYSLQGVMPESLLNAPMAPLKKLIAGPLRQWSKADAAMADERAPDADLNVQFDRTGRELADFLRAAGTDSSKESLDALKAKLWADVAGPKVLMPNAWKSADALTISKIVGTLHNEPSIVTDKIFIKAAGDVEAAFREGLRRPGDIAGGLQRITLYLRHVIMYIELSSKGKPAGVRAKLKAASQKVLAVVTNLWRKATDHNTAMMDRKTASKNFQIIMQEGNQVSISSKGTTLTWKAALIKGANGVQFLRMDNNNRYWEISTFLQVMVAAQLITNMPVEGEYNRTTVRIVGGETVTDFQRITRAILSEAKDASMTALLERIKQLRYKASPYTMPNGTVRISVVVPEKSGENYKEETIPNFFRSLMIIPESYDFGGNLVIFTFDPAPQVNATKDSLKEQNSAAINSTRELIRLGRGKPVIERQNAGERIRRILSKLIESYRALSFLHVTERITWTQATIGDNDWGIFQKNVRTWLDYVSTNAGVSDLNQQLASLPGASEATKTILPFAVLNKEGAGSFANAWSKEAVLRFLKDAARAIRGNTSLRDAFIQQVSDAAMEIEGLEKYVTTHPDQPVTIMVKQQAMAKWGPVETAYPVVLRNIKFDPLTITGLSEKGNQLHFFKSEIRSYNVQPGSTIDNAGVVNTGGIDLNSAGLDLQIKRDGNGVPLPVSQQNLDNIKIEGLVPVILNIQPAVSAPMFSELAGGAPSTV